MDFLNEPMYDNVTISLQQLNVKHIAFEYAQASVLGRYTTF